MDTNEKNDTFLEYLVKGALIGAVLILNGREGHWTPEETEVSTFLKLAAKDEPIDTLVKNINSDPEWAKIWSERANTDVKFYTTWAEPGLIRRIQVAKGFTPVYLPALRLPQVTERSFVYIRSTEGPEVLTFMQRITRDRRKSSAKDFAETYPGNLGHFLTVIGTDHTPEGAVH